MNILFLMAGDNLNSSTDNYPIYMIEINQKMILEILIDYTKSVSPNKALFCIKEDAIKNFYLDEIIKRKIEDVIIIPIKGETKGAVCSSLLSADYIDNNEELLIVAINDFTDVDWSVIIDYFREHNCDAGIVSFNSVHPRYSFAKINEDNEVIEVTEKKPMSTNALVSFYYFRSGKDYVFSAKNVIRKDNPINGYFYLSQVINEMILENKKIGFYRIDNSKFHPLKTELQLAQYISELKDSQSLK